MTIASVLLLALSIWFVQHLRERHRAEELGARYQMVLAGYAIQVKPGMTREEVERYLQTTGKQFKQMCCVANFKGGYVSFERAGWDDLVRIGAENVPWFCSENNVYIAFEFNPKSQAELPDTNGSDILKRVSVFHELEGCL
jgi:hypothetical protein